MSSTFSNTSYASTEVPGPATKKKTYQKSGGVAYLRNSPLVLDHVLSLRPHRVVALRRHVRHLHRFIASQESNGINGRRVSTRVDKARASNSWTHMTAGGSGEHAVVMGSSLPDGARGAAQKKKKETEEARREAKKTTDRKGADIKDDMARGLFLARRSPERQSETRGHMVVWCADVNAQDLKRGATVRVGHSDSIATPSTSPRCHDTLLDTRSTCCFPALATLTWKLKAR